MQGRRPDDLPRRGLLDEPANVNPKTASQESIVLRVGRLGHRHRAIRAVSSRPPIRHQYVPAFTPRAISCPKFLQAHLSDMGTPAVLTMGTGPYSDTRFQPDKALPWCATISIGDQKPSRSSRYLALVHYRRKFEIARAFAFRRWNFAYPARSDQPVEYRTYGYRPGETRRSFFTRGTANPPFQRPACAQGIRVRAGQQRELRRPSSRGTRNPRTRWVPPDGWANLLSKQAIAGACSCNTRLT